MKQTDLKSNYKSLKNSGLTPSEKKVAIAPINLIISEYELIQKKQSTLPRSMRETVKLRYEYLVKSGKINPAQNGEK